MGQLLSSNKTSKSKKDKKVNQESIIKYDDDHLYCAATLRGHKFSVFSIVKLSSTMVASGSQDWDVRVWRRHIDDEVEGKDKGTEEGQEVKKSQESQQHWRCAGTLVGHKGSVTCLTAIPIDENREDAAECEDFLVISGSLDNTIKVWEVAGPTMRCAATLTNSDYIYSLCRYVPLDEDGQEKGGKYFFSGSHDKFVKLWQLIEDDDDEQDTKKKKEKEKFGNWQCQKTYLGHTDGVRCLEVLPKAKVLASAGYDFTVRLWDIESEQCLRVLEGHTDGVLCMRVIPWPLTESGFLLGSCGLTKDNTIRMWNTETGECVYKWVAHADGVMSLQILPETNRLISSSMDKTIKLWDLNALEKLGAAAGKEEEEEKGEEGEAKEAEGKDKKEEDEEGEEEQKENKEKEEKDGGMVCLRTFEGHRDFVYGTALLSPEFVASCCQDHTLKIWNIQL